MIFTDIYFNGLTMSKIGLKVILIDNQFIVFDYCVMKLKINRTLKVMRISQSQGLVLEFQIERFYAWNNTD